MFKYKDTWNFIDRLTDSERTVERQKEAHRGNS